MGQTEACPSAGYQAAVALEIMARAVSPAFHAFAAPASAPGLNCSKIRTATKFIERRLLSVNCGKYDFSVNQRRVFETHCRELFRLWKGL